MSRPLVILCDLDGVIWLARQPLPRSADAIAELRAAGHKVLFVTNNSYATREQQEEYLAEVGIGAEGEVLSSAMAAATLVEPNSRVLICGGQGLSQAVRERGAHPIEMKSAATDITGIDAVVVGFHRSFDYESLRLSSLAIQRGARFIASNEDPTYPTPDGPIPGGGSIVAAVATASSSRPVIAGKPHEAMASLVRSVVPDVDERSVMVGDRPSTDGRFALRLGCRFGLVHSDVSREEAAARSRVLGGGDIGAGDRDASFDFAGSSLWDVACQILERG